MDALGGTCDVRNREDGCQGSVFTFSFPYLPDPQINCPRYMKSQKSVLRPVSSDSDISCSNDGDDHDKDEEKEKEDKDEEKAKGKDHIEHSGLNATLQESPKESESKSLLFTAKSMPPLRILVVDDSPSIVKVAKRFLTEHGHTVDTADNGSEALEKLKKVREGGNGNVSFYDMMLTDIQMPVMDGMECTKRYRQWESEGSASTTERISAMSSMTSNRLLIVGMSANNDDEVANEGLSNGMNCFMPKVWCRSLICYPFLLYLSFTSSFRIIACHLLSCTFYPP